MLTEELKTKLDHKYVLFDSGVLTRASDHFEMFEGFFEALDNISCKSVSFPLVEFEFVRGAIEEPHQKKREEFLKAIGNNSLAYPKNMIEDAISIARAYAVRKLSPPPSIVDCCIAAYLKQYPGNLFLATLNHRDFPTYLFDRYPIIPLDTSKELLPLAFYEYNPSKASEIDL